MKKAIFYSLVFFTLAGSGCRCDKESDPAPVAKAGNVNFKISYSVDGQALIFDTVIYQNAAGNQYQISSLLYYLSGFTFYKSDGNYHYSNHVQYIDARDLLSNEFVISGVPFGNYTAITFHIGVDSARNIPGGLPASSNNINMEWPVSMGGGYHFLKFEGYYIDNLTTPGFTMHLGRNENLVRVLHPVLLNVQSGNHAMNMNMNINEWFKNPHTWDFNIDGNYTMGVADAMLKLSENGRDVFNQ